MYQIFIITLCFFSSLSASTWHDHWTNGAIYCTNGQYTEGEYEFNQAISLLEAENISMDYPHVYLDRARLYFITNTNERTLQDIDLALSSNKLSAVDEGKARGLRYTILYRMDRVEEAEAEYKIWKKNDPNFPKCEIFEDKIIVRNIPDSECYKKMVKGIMVESKMCASEDDITFLPSKVCIIKKKVCKCGCKDRQAGIIRKRPTKEEEEEDCKYWCARVANAAQAWCVTHMKNAGCVVVCSVVVDILKEQCNSCCEDGKFYENCVKDFEDLTINFLKKQGEGCEPIW